MNKNLKIITINGIRGLIMSAFIIMGLIAGFIISPAWVCMKLWNFYVADYFSLPNINIFQGLLMWAVIALCVYALNNKRTLIGFGSYPRLSKEQIQDIINKSEMSDSDILEEIEKVQKSMMKDSSEQTNKENKTSQENEKEDKEEIRG